MHRRPQPVRCSRRRALQTGLLGSSLCGLHNVSLLRAHSSVSPQRARSCVFVFLFGGPSHIDLWDMKPQAPAEIRGEFHPVATETPGILLCEHLPRLARQTNRLCLLRSMTHRMPVHGPACSEVYTGREYFGPPVTDQALPEDWPSLASLTMRFAPPSNGLPPSIVLPWYTQFDGQDRRIAGQTGGRMGDHWEPFLVEGNPTSEEFDVPGLRLPQSVSQERFERRRQLQQFLTSQSLAGDHAAEKYGALQATALQLVERVHTTDAFALQRESPATREWYGHTRFGQSLLLARRLVERDVPFVTVNWDDETRSEKVSPHWDTHHENFPRLKSILCPIFDTAFSAFLEDLDQRGLLADTLVVALGEFGRTPHIGLVTQNGMTERTGRDHWPHAFTALLAGGGIAGGQVYGATNADGGYVVELPVSPADLTATILWHLGIDPQLTYLDLFQQMERRLSEGRVISFPA